MARPADCWPSNSGSSFGRLRGHPRACPGCQTQPGTVSRRFHVPAQGRRGCRFEITNCDLKRWPRRAPVCPICVYRAGCRDAVQCAPKPTGDACQRRDHASVRQAASDAGISRGTGSEATSSSTSLPVCRKIRSCEIFPTWPAKTSGLAWPLPLTESGSWCPCRLSEGAPLWIRLGNCSTEEIARLLRQHHADLLAFGEETEGTFLALG